MLSFGVMLELSKTPNVTLSFRIPTDTLNSLNGVKAEVFVTDFKTFSFMEIQGLISFHGLNLTFQIFVCTTKNIFMMRA